MKSSSIKRAYRPLGIRLVKPTVHHRGDVSIAAYHDGIHSHLMVMDSPLRRSLGKLPGIPKAKRMMVYALSLADAEKN